MNVTAAEECASTLSSLLSSRADSAPCLFSWRRLKESHITADERESYWDHERDGKSWRRWERLQVLVFSAMLALKLSADPSLKYVGGDLMMPCNSFKGLHFYQMMRLVDSGDYISVLPQDWPARFWQNCLKNWRDGRSDIWWKYSHSIQCEIKWPHNVSVRSQWNLWGHWTWYHKVYFSFAKSFTSVGFASSCVI